MHAGVVFSHSEVSLDGRFHRVAHTDRRVGKIIGSDAPNVMQEGSIRGAPVRGLLAFSISIESKWTLEPFPFEIAHSRRCEENCGTLSG